MPEPRAYGPVVDAVLRYDAEALQQALALDPGLASAPDADYTPLHYAIVQGWDAGLEALLDAGADVHAASAPDRSYRVGAKLYQTGGGTALLRRVLEAAGGADAPADGRAALLAARDFDGHDAATVAQLHLRGRACCAEVLRVLGAEPWSDEEFRARRTAWLAAQRVRIDLATAAQDAIAAVLAAQAQDAI